MDELLKLKAKIEANDYSGCHLSADDKDRIQIAIAVANTRIADALEMFAKHLEAEKAK